MRTAPIKKPDAASAMLEARTWLAERAIPHHYLPRYQLKIGAINFWPGTGTITVDGEGQRRAEKGLAGLALLLFGGASTADAARSAPGTDDSMTLRQLCK